jgi:hypothetical protein
LNEMLSSIAVVLPFGVCILNCIPSTPHKSAKKTCSEFIKSAICVSTMHIAVRKGVSVVKLFEYVDSSTEIYLAQLLLINDPLQFENSFCPPYLKLVKTPYCSSVDCRTFKTHLFFTTTKDMRICFLEQE